jgi:heme oxygenase
LIIARYGTSLGALGEPRRRMKVTPELAASTLATGAAPRSGVADAMRRRTAELHGRAERSGIIAAIMGGRATRAGYALFLRNLLPAYRELEGGLERWRSKPGFGGLFRWELSRTSALESDIAGLSPPGSTALPLLPEGRAYACRIAAAAEGDGSLLIAHAYTRFLGDLAGGLLLRRKLAATLALGSSTLSFYDFPPIPDLGLFFREYRSALDAAAAEIADVGAVVEEAAAAFQLNIDLSTAVEV